MSEQAKRNAAIAEKVIDLLGNEYECPRTGTQAASIVDRAYAEAARRVDLDRAAPAKVTP